MRKKIFEIMIFQEIGDSPEPKIGGQLSKIDFHRKRPCHHFKTEMGSFGCKMRELWMLDDFLGVL